MSSDYLYDLMLEITVAEGETITYKMANLPLGETKATGLYAVSSVLISQMYGAIHIGYDVPLQCNTELDCTPLTKAIDEALEIMSRGTDIVTTIAEMPNSNVGVTVMRRVTGYKPMTKRTDNL